MDPSIQAAIEQATEKVLGAPIALDPASADDQAWISMGWADPDEEC